MDTITRFMNFVEFPKSDQFGNCWLWTGGSSVKKKTHLSIKRAAFWLNGKTIHASRAAWLLWWGPIPDDKWVLHNCDNHACVNPHHLYLGTCYENAQDRARRNPDSFVKGNQHGKSILTEDMVRVIKSKYKKGIITQPMLAAEFGVARTTIQAILDGRNWKHV